MAVVGRFGVAAALLLATTLATNEVGTKLLEENAKKEGVVVLPSGLQYRVLRKGEGNFQPTEDSPCECSYKGWIAQKFPDGMTFDGSEGKLIPMLFNPSRVIKGWGEALQLMVEGDQWELFVPSELGYGEKGRYLPPIGPGDALVFRLELVKIHGDKIPVGAKHSPRHHAAADEL